MHEMKGQDTNMNREQSGKSVLRGYKFNSIGCFDFVMKSFIIEIQSTETELTIELKYYNYIKISYGLLSTSNFDCINYVS